MNWVSGSSGAILAVLPHPRTCGSVSGGALSTLESSHRIEPRHLTKRSRKDFGKAWFMRLAPLSNHCPRRIASHPLPVRQTSALPSASSRFPVAQNTLAVRLTISLFGRIEDFHLRPAERTNKRRQKPPCGLNVTRPEWS